MSTLNLRVGNDALTFQELDDNFTNLNNDKYEINDSPQFTAVGIGTAASTIALDISATNAIKIPVGTDAQRPTAATGMIRYNTTSSSFEGYSGTAWASLGGVKDVDGDTTILAESSAGADEDVLTFITGGANSAVLSSTQFDVEVNLDVTGTITASSTISGSNLSGTNTGDEPAASATVAGIVELATVSEVNTGTDTVRAVTPAGVAGFTGSANVVTLGTITTGTWNGSAISTAYISNLSGTNTGDEPAASATVAGIVELATTAETTTGTDTTRAVTPDGLKDGYQGSTNVTTLGTIATGTWNGSVIASAYLDSDTAHLSGSQTFSGAKSFSSGISFGNQIAPSDVATDLSNHIALYSTSYGLSITSNNLNLVSGGTNTLSSTSTAITSKVNHDFSAGIDVTGQVDADTFQEALTTSTGGSYAVNCTLAGVHWRTLNGACTVSFTNTPASNTSKSVTLIFQQDATGGRVITWPTTNWYWAENIEPPQSTGANDIDVYNVQIINNGGTLYYYASLGVKNAS